MFSLPAWCQRVGIPCAALLQIPPQCKEQNLLNMFLTWVQSGKLSGYETDIRLPFYVRGPGVPKVRLASP